MKNMAMLKRELQVLLQPAEGTVAIYKPIMRRRQLLNYIMYFDQPLLICGC